MGVGRGSGVPVGVNDGRVSTGTGVESGSSAHAESVITASSASSGKTAESTESPPKALTDIREIRSSRIRHHLSAYQVCLAQCIGFIKYIDMFRCQVTIHYPLPAVIFLRHLTHGAATLYVIGTAGHVDHGKSTLVQALTGIDPDRLREEKERGMTIDLGFAWLRLPSGNEVSIVDVPGHERFVNNMLAGVGGIDLALLVVAADESVMPQTREHLAILDLLKVERGLVAVTKSDLVDDDWYELVETDVEDVLEDTALEGSAILPVSAVTGEGLPELLAAVDEMLRDSPPKRDLERPRLPIDRSFTIAGFGTVVTGTLIDGSLDAGEGVELVLSRRETRIRGLQTHRSKVDRAMPGTRVAANLSGIPHEDISRGEVLTRPGWLRPTGAMDVRLKIIPDAPHPVRHNMFVTVHTGSSEAIARVRLLETHSATQGETTWAQLKLSTPLAVIKGDSFVIRSNRTTLGGGDVVDPHARRHRRMFAPLLDRLSVMESGSDRDVILKTIELSEPSEFSALVYARQPGPRGRARRAFRNGR